MRFEGLTPLPIRPAPGPVEMAMGVAMRVTGALALALAVVAMARMSGVQLAGFDAARFDLSAPLLRFSLLLQLVLCAASALGLWSRAPWGTVLWAFTIAALFVLNGVEPFIFEGNVMILAAMIGSISILVVLIMVQYMQERRKSAVR
jgi:hypothetical protein